MRRYGFQLSHRMLGVIPSRKEKSGTPQYAGFNVFAVSDGSELVFFLVIFFIIVVFFLVFLLFFVCVGFDVGAAN